jgi:tRNA splicing endonuclease
MYMVEILYSHNESYYIYYYSDLQHINASILTLFIFCAKKDAYEAIKYNKISW